MKKLEYLVALFSKTWLYKIFVFFVSNIRFVCYSFVYLLYYLFYLVFLRQIFVPLPVLLMNYRIIKYILYVYLFKY